MDRLGARTFQGRASGGVFWVVGLAVGLSIGGLAAPPAATGSAQPGSLGDRQIQERVEKLLSQMTLQEKVGQLTQLFPFAFPGAPKPEDLIRKGELGSMLFLTDPAQINQLQRIAVEETRLKIPLLFGYDVIHGFRTIFPVPIGLAASWDPSLVEQVQTVAAREASSVGIRWTFAPMVDIARDPRWGRIVEGAGEDPYLGSAIAAAQVRGFQGARIGSPEHVIACVKHFAAYGAAEGGRDYDSAYVPEVLLRNVYLPPFHAAVKAGVGSLMTAYMDLNDVPATGNPFLVDEILRRAWGFEGFVVSDAFSVQGQVAHGFARDPADAARRALLAGVDMDMGSRVYRQHVPQLLETGELTEPVLNTAVSRLLAAKVRLGLFENPYADADLAARTLGAEAHRELARDAARRSAVLLRNEGLLPLDREAYSSIAVIGPLGDAKKDLLGSWSTAGDTENVVTLLEGIRAKVGDSVGVEFAPGVQIKRRFPSIFDTFFPGPKQEDWDEARAKAEFDKAVELAASADLVVLALGERENMSGEAASRASIDLPGQQQRLMEAVVAKGKPTVLTLVSGRPLNLSWASRNVAAILDVWHPGSEGGAAVADLLYGDANPGGKLPFSWPREVGQVPIYYAHNTTHEPEDAPNFKSRYWDLESSPLYPFGFGLSYTRFEFSNLRLSQSEIRVGETIEVTVDVENKGSRPGSVVGQLYIHQRSGSASRPVRELKGFQRAILSAGGKKTLRFSLGPDELRFWSPVSKDWVQEAAGFDVWAGGDSTAQLHSTFQVKP